MNAAASHYQLNQEAGVTASRLISDLRAIARTWAKRPENVLLGTIPTGRGNSGRFAGPNTGNRAPDPRRPSSGIVRPYTMRYGRPRLRSGN